MLAKAFVVAAIAAAAAAQSAVLTFTRVPNPITDGQPQAITYATNDTNTAVTILLRQGTTGDLKNISTLTTEARGGQYIWTPPLDLPNGQDYYLEIRQSTQNNTFGPFTVQGFTPNASSNSTTTTRSTSSSGSTTAFVGTSAGTGTALPRNTTMSIPTLSRISTTPVTVTATSTSPAPTGNGAVGDFKAGGAIAALLGAAAAAAML